MKLKSLSRVRLFATSWTEACQAPASMEFSRHEYWSGLPFPSPGYLPNTGIEPRSPALQADSLSSEPRGSLSMFFAAYFVRSSVREEWVLDFSRRAGFKLGAVNY